MDDQVFQAALAGLLHGLGEFAQRAGHTNLKVTDLVPAPWRQALTPEDPLTSIVNEAVQLAAGGEVLVSQSQPEQLRSIFCSLEGLINEQQQRIVVPQAEYLPLAALKIDEKVIFPQPKANDSATAYKNLWAQFTQALKALKLAHESEQADQESYLNSLLRLMQQYCWSVPVVFGQSQTQVSLYDYSRITSALAACLVDRPAAQNEVALLVGGDISGVQKFIYTITSCGATSGLRGRSMYLQLLTEVVARYLLNQVGMPLSNLIYAGGGHFYLLIPFNKKAELLKARQETSRVLLHHHQGDLYLAIASQPLQAPDFAGQRLPQKWGQLQQGLQQAKQQLFSELADEVTELLFAPQEHGGNEDKLCVVCQREHPDVEMVETPRKCPVCKGFEELGKDLREAAYFCLDEIDLTPLPDKTKPPDAWQTILAHFGYRAKFTDLKQKIPQLTSLVKRRTLLALNDTALAGLAPGPKQVVGRHLLVNVTPILSEDEHQEFQAKLKDLPEAGSVKPFEVMAEQAEGIKRLGILRMDVDNLGQIFSRGLGSQVTLAQVASLSFAFSLFFEGWLEQIAVEVNHSAKLNQNREKSRGLIYSIYSGGDDLFLVGAWDLMPRLAERISQDLHKYSAHHPGVHLSGGIALAGSKYPLYQAAEDAHEAEQAAKAKRSDGHSKNALNFLEQTIPWEKFEGIKKQQMTLTEMVATDKAPAALLQRLNQLYLEYEQTNRELALKGQDGRVYWGPWHWHGAYSLSRLADRVEKKDESAAVEIKSIREALRLEGFTNIEWISLAARWAELLVREND